MNITLTFDLNTVIHYLGPVMDRLIEEEVELPYMWIAFSEYLVVYANRRIHYVGVPAVEDDVFVELDTAYFGIGLTPKLIRSAFDGAIAHYRTEIDAVLQVLIDKQLNLDAVEGMWEEPMLHFHPLLVFKCSYAPNPQPLSPPSLL